MAPPSFFLLQSAFIMLVFFMFELAYPATAESIFCFATGVSLLQLFFIRCTTLKSGFRWNNEVTYGLKTRQLLFPCLIGFQDKPSREQWFFINIYLEATTPSLVALLPILYPCHFGFCSSKLASVIPIPIIFSRYSHKEAGGNPYQASIDRRRTVFFYSLFPQWLLKCGTPTHFTCSHPLAVVLTSKAGSSNCP